MERNSLKFTTLFGIALIVIGLLLELGGVFYHPGSLESAETVFTGAIAISVGHAFYGLDSLLLSLALTAISSIGIGYYVFVQTTGWLWTIIATIAFFAFIVALFQLRGSIRHRHGTW
jgi:uncharacterized membrane protein